MREQIEVVYENGILRPLGPIPGGLREQQRLIVTIEAAEESVAKSAAPTASTPGQSNASQSQQIPSVKLPAEILEWARQQFTEEEIVAGLREVRETGGLELKDFVHELEQAAHGDD